MKRAKVVKRLDRLGRELDLIAEINRQVGAETAASAYESAALLVRREATKVKDRL